MLVFLVLIICSGAASASSENNQTLTTEYNDEIVNIENTDEKLTVEMSSAGSEDDSGLKELESETQEKDLNKTNFIKKENNLLKASNDNQLLGKTVNVEGNTFSAIQSAINSASAGDIIYLNSPLYTGSGNDIFLKPGLTIIGCEGCTLDAKGKSNIFHYPSSYVSTTEIKTKIYNITFCNSKSAIYHDIMSQDINYMIYNCTFINNTNTAIFLSTRTNSDHEKTPLNHYLMLSDCDFINNTGTNGGAIFIRDMYEDQYIVVSGPPKWLNSFNTNIFIKGCYFENNTANENGGAIHYSSVSGYDYADDDVLSICNLTISKCNFKNNTANNGGAVYCDVGKSYDKYKFREFCNLNISFCNFTDNNASGNGGAISMKYTNSIFTDCNFNNNSAVTGGAVYNYKHFAYNQFDDDFILRCNFSNNAANENGGAIYSKSGQFKYFFNDSSFIDNKARASYLQGNVPNFSLSGYHNYINALHIADTNTQITFDNVTYWNGNIVNSDIVTPRRSSQASGINITVEVYDSNNRLVDNVTIMTNENGIANYIYGDKLNYELYTYKAYHKEDAYYTYTQASGTFMGPKLFNLTILDNKTHYVKKNMSTTVYAKTSDFNIESYFYIEPSSYNSLPTVIGNPYLFVEWQWDEEIYNQYGLENTMLIITVDGKQYTFEGTDMGFGDVIIGDIGTTHDLSIELYQYNNNYKTDGMVIYSDSVELTIAKLLFIHLHKL